MKEKERNSIAKRVRIRGEGRVRGGGVFLVRTRESRALLSLRSRFSFPVYTGCTHIDGEKQKKLVEGREDGKGAIVSGFVKIGILARYLRVMTRTDHRLLPRPRENII